MCLTSFSIIFYALFDWEFKKGDEGVDLATNLSPLSTPSRFPIPTTSQLPLPAKTFMNNPELYGIGLRNEKFNNWRFLLWLVMGWIQAAFIFFTCMKWPQEPESSNGPYSYNLFAGGQNVYAACVIVVNLVILNM